MNRQAPAEAHPVPAAAQAEPLAATRPSWRVRLGEEVDVPEIAAAVRELLVELGGTPPPAAEMEAVARTLVSDRDSGAVLVAEAGRELVGVLAISWQSAIHAAGRYGLIQDLWVHPSWRNAGIGRALLAALADLARGQGVTRMEVGLPRERFPGFASTESFYRANGFAPLGPRMRRALP